MEIVNVAAAVLAYGLMMGYIKHHHEAVLGVGRFAIGISLCQGLLCLLVPAALVGLSLVLYLYHLEWFGLSWQMRRSYPTHPDPVARMLYTSLYVQREGKL